MKVATFAEIQPELEARAKRIVWCTVTTIDTKGRTRSRILHPVWDGSTAWILTGRDSLKAKHLAKHPHLSLTYWDQQHQQVYADCVGAWEEDAAEKQHIWKLFESTPEPYGYNPAMFWKGPDDPAFGALKCTPWRVELYSLPDMASGKSPLVWRPK